LGDAKGKKQKQKLENQAAKARAKKQVTAKAQVAAKRVVK